jgi:serine/threonine-protein kinase
MNHPSPRTHDEGAPRPDPFAGTNYRIVRKLGDGGGGSVHEAVHVTLGKRVAIKVLHRALTREPVCLERMRVEAQALARLRSPHIVEVTDYGQTADGRPFYVMELLVGTNLADELERRGSLPATEAVDLVQQLLDGLAVAHRAGLVHRDIKLDNLFLCEGEGGSRVLKILDFGIAKVLPTATGAEPLTMQTNEGAVLGTPRFIPPEQVLGSDIDGRADVYGAGTVLYELLTGRDPFHHIDSNASLLLAALSEDPPPPSRVASVPIEQALEDVVLRALAKQPQDRYKSAEEMSQALRRATELVAAAEMRRRSGAPLPVAVLLVIASAALSALVALWLTRTP